MRVKIHFDKSKSKTKREFKQECDINFLMSRYKKTGHLPALIKQNPMYGNFASSTDYQEALNTVMHAQEQFEALPAEVRKEFGHDPSRMLEFVADPKNTNKMVEMGLATIRPSTVTGTKETPKGDSLKSGSETKDK